MQQPSIFITGAGKGIGKATALLFAQRGWFIGLSDINQAALDAVAQEIGESQCSTHLMDVRDTGQIEAAMAAFGQRTGQRMNALFNNAGILIPGGFEQIELKQHHALIDINLTGVVNVTHYALPLLKPTPRSAVITMCSASAIYGNPELTTYAATKSAVKSLTEGMNMLFRKHDTHAADLLPAYVRTDLVTDVQSDMQLADRDVKLRAEDIAKVVWKAVHSKKIHYYIGFDSNLFRFCKWLLPTALLEGILKNTYYKRALDRN